MSFDDTPHTLQRPILWALEKTTSAGGSGESQLKGVALPDQYALLLENEKKSENNQEVRGVVLEGLLTWIHFFGRAMAQRREVVRMRANSVGLALICIASFCLGSAAKAGDEPGAVGKRWVEDHLKEISSRGDPVDSSDTAALLAEAERWRWGTGNYSADGTHATPPLPPYPIMISLLPPVTPCLPRTTLATATRATSLYWAAASGTGPAAASAMNQLAW